MNDAAEKLMNECRGFSVVEQISNPYLRHVSGDVFPASGPRGVTFFRGFLVWNSTLSRALETGGGWHLECLARISHSFVTAMKLLLGYCRCIINAVFYGGIFADRRTTAPHCGVAIMRLLWLIVVMLSDLMSYLVILPQKI